MNNDKEEINFENKQINSSETTINTSNENDLVLQKKNNLSHKERVKKIKEDKKKSKAAKKDRIKYYRNKETNNKSSKKDKSFYEWIKDIKLTPKRIIAFILIVILITSIFFFIFERDIITYDNLKNFVEYGILNKDKDQRFPIEIQGSNIANNNFDRIGNYMCYTSDTHFIVTNNYGVETYNAKISYSKPVMSTSNEKCIVYDLGDTGFQINDKDKNIYTGESENNILVASVNDKGMYALVTEYDGYLSKLFVYDENNTQIYAYSFADYYITSVSINSDGHRIALCGSTALEGKEISAVYVLDITKQEPIVFNEFESNLLYKISFLGDNNACAIGNNECYGFKINSGDFSSTNYSGKALTSYTINKTNNTFNISLTRSGDGRNCDILTIDGNGNTIGTIESNLKVTALSSYKGRIGALANGKIYLFTRSGRQLCERSVGLDIHSFCMYTKWDTYLLGVSNISRSNL